MKIEKRMLFFKMMINLNEQLLNNCPNDKRK